jgi:hypothetical protein
MIDQRTLIIYGLGGGAIVAFCCFVALTALLVRKRSTKKKNEALFGSTIKISSYSTASVIPTSFYIQPKKKEGTIASNDGTIQHDSSSETDLTKIESLEAQNGLSGYRSNSQRSSYDSATTETSCRIEIESSEWRVWFKIQYDEVSENLDITIYRAKCCSGIPFQLATKSSVFFILYLLPDENNRQQTALYPNNGSPSFDETLRFRLLKHQVDQKKLRLSLYELDASRTRMVLGHVIVKLDDLQVADGGIHYMCRNMQMQATSPASNLGDVHVSLCYDVQTEKMKVQIFAAKDLAESKAKTRYYLQTNVIMGTRSVKSKRTEDHTSLSGVFNCLYVFQVPCKHLDACCLHFSVKQIDENDEEKPYGYFLIGPCAFTHGTGLTHWKQMVGNTKKVVEMWHKILEYE